MKAWQEIAMRLPAERPLVGTEVGVLSGATSAALLRAMPGLTLHMVDWWRAVPDAATRRQWTPDGHVGETKDQMDAALLAALRNTEQFADRRIVVVADALDAARCLPDRQDFVYLDANHTEAATLAAIRAYWPLVRPGGLLCGHDYASGIDGWDVERAVGEFAAEHSLALETGQDCTWFLRKETE